MGERTFTLAIEGMDCAGCAAPIELGLRLVPGVVEARIDYKKALCTVTAEDARVEAKTLVEAVEKMGFQARESPASPKV